MSNPQPQALAAKEVAVEKESRPNSGEGLRRINFFQAMLFRIYGPADLGFNGPLAGTKYCPVAKRQRELRRWEEHRQLQCG